VLAPRDDYLVGARVGGIIVTGRFVEEDEVTCCARRNEAVEDRPPVARPIHDRIQAKLFRREREDDSSPQAEPLGFFERDEVGTTSARAHERQNAFSDENGSDTLADQTNILQRKSHGIGSATIDPAPAQSNHCRI
jgi:hypothetical protein